MHNIKKSTLAITLLSSSIGMAYSAPCYTNMNDGCDNSQQVIHVQTRDTDFGFCTEYINDKNQKEVRCHATLSDQEKAIADAPQNQTQATPPVNSNTYNYNTSNQTTNNLNYYTSGYDNNHNAGYSSSYSRSYNNSYNYGYGMSYGYRGNNGYIYGWNNPRPPNHWGNNRPRPPGHWGGHRPPPPGHRPPPGHGGNHYPRPPQHNQRVTLPSRPVNGGPTMNRSSASPSRARGNNAPRFGGARSAGSARR